MAVVLPYKASAAAGPDLSLYSFSLARPDGTLLPLSAYKGKVVVIVNLASKSGFADQLAALEKLQQTDANKGLVVLGIPSNDFGAEEPGSDAEVQKFYANEHITFAVAAKSSVSGKDELPVYAFLTAGASKTKNEQEKSKKPQEAEAVHWNYTKFIVSRDGQVAARLAPDIAPDSPEFEIALDQALSGKGIPVSGKPSSSTVKGARSRDDDGGEP